MKEIRALTGIRGFAALTVFFAHTRETLISRGLDLPIPQMVQRLFLSGGRQVDIFFVLSGFILAMIYGTWFDGSVSRHSYFKFLQRRFARIYPLHAFILILIISFVFAAQLTNAPIRNGLGRFDFSRLPAYFLLVQAWRQGMSADSDAWNPPSWSISIEALAYLMFPLLLWATTKVRKEYIWLLLAASIICGFALNAMTPWGLAGFPGISRGLSEFVLGCVTASLYGTALANWLRGRSGSLIALMVLAVCFTLTPDTGFVVGLCTAPLLLALCGENPVARFCGWAPVFFLGEISYSVYLGHFLFSSIAYRIISVPWMESGPAQTLLGLLGIGTFVLLLSTLCYYFVERPGRDLLSGRRKSRQVAATAEARNAVG